MQKEIDLNKYGQYKNDIFNKIGIKFENGKKLLDVGCGDGSDSQIFINEFSLEVYGIDIYEHKKVSNIKEFKFQKAGIYNIPYASNTFDYVFLHDILHHIDESGQRHEKHLHGLRELKRVCNKGGYIIIVEGNRYNPLFYPHMVLMKGHNHFTQKYFKKVVREVFKNVNFKYFECHNYMFLISFWKVYEFLMEKLSPKQFLAYNVAIIKNDK